MTGADVGKRNDARCDGRPKASKISGEFSPCVAAATHASRTRNVKPNPQAARLDRSQDSSPAELSHAHPESQSV
jgi:hypothetical protein